MSPMLCHAVTFLPHQAAHHACMAAVAAWAYVAFCSLSPSQILVLLPAATLLSWLRISLDLQLCFGGRSRMVLLRVHLQLTHAAIMLNEDVNYQPSYRRPKATDMAQMRHYEFDCVPAADFPSLALEEENKDDSFDAQRRAKQHAKWMSQAPVIFDPSVDDPRLRWRGSVSILPPADMQSSCQQSIDLFLFCLAGLAAVLWWTALGCRHAPDISACVWPGNSMSSWQNSRDVRSGRQG